MRDATIDGRAVPCPNASLLGYGMGKAKVGHFLLYDSTGTAGSGFARMIGRVAYASPTKDTPAIKNWILALVMSSTGCSAYVRWIDPTTVQYVSDSPSRFAEFFFQKTLPFGRDMLVRLAEHGTLSEQYVEHAAERVDMFAQREKVEG